MKKLLPLFLLLTAIAHATVVVSVSPLSASLASGATQQYTCTITGVVKGGSLAVTWSASEGTISNSGLFTAPIVGTRTTVTITARRVAPHQSQFGTATATISPVQHTVDLTWNASVGALTYSIYRSVTSGSGYALVASSIIDTAYTDNTVVSGQTYYYVVTASNDSGESGYSNEAIAVVP